jgi:protein TonB
MMRASARSGLQWSAAALLVTCGHVAVVVAAFDRNRAEPMPSQAPAAILIDMVAAPDKPPLDVAPGPETTESIKEEETRPVGTAKVEPTIELPKTEPRENAAVVLPPPMPEPAPEERPKPKPEPKAEKKPEERKKSENSRASASPSFRAPRVATAAAQAAGAAQAMAVAPASWKGAVLAALNRHKRYPGGASGTGTAMIAFSMNRSGQVTSARLLHSSGDRVLDEEAVSLPRRASPLPPPPSELGGGAVNLNVPVRFSR